jgi:hypothetical protein
VLGGGEDGSEVCGSGQGNQRAGAAIGAVLETGGRVLPQERERGGMGAVGHGKRPLSVGSVLDEPERSPPAVSDIRQIDAVEHGEVVNRRAVQVCGGILGDIDAGGIEDVGIRTAVDGQHVAAGTGGQRIDVLCR